MKKTRSKAQARGFVLISSVLILIILTLLALSMFRSFGIQDRIAGNVREKQRALHAAIAAQEYAEWWLLQTSATSAQPCNGAATLLNANAGQTQVCSNALANPTTVPWVNGTALVGITYLPPSTSASSFAVSGTGGDGTYYQVPQFYIQDVGAAPGAQGELYRIEGLGYGGSPNAVAVVESTFVVTTKIRDLGGQP